MKEQCSVGSWYGDDACFGLHFDFHARPGDKDIGKRADAEVLCRQLESLAPDFVQTDCKGHPGYTSWFSHTPGASVAPDLKKDLMEVWRKATAEAGLPLHCHYSGIIDNACAEKHPEWVTVTETGKAAKGHNTGAGWERRKMCVRSGYLREFMIPQLLELIDRYNVDGFWIDGDIWAMDFCRCERCCEAFTAETGIDAIPEKTDDPHWGAWANFHRESFYRYVTQYVEAVHSHKPSVRVCSNWMQTFLDPGPPKVPTDWISGDNPATNGLNSCRLHARFISTRGKPWDIMLWGWYFKELRNQEYGWFIKPAQMIQQEAVPAIALGGGIQIFERPNLLRDGRLIDWRLDIYREVRDFVKARRALCVNAETIPQIAVLHSEAHLHAQPITRLHGGYDCSHVEGAVFSLLENSFSVDILDEWALLPRMAEYPMVVVPESENMSEAAVEAVRNCVAGGGVAVISGTAAFDRFGCDFLGCESLGTIQGMTDITSTTDFCIPAGHEAFQPHSPEWRLLRCTGAVPFRLFHKTLLLDEDETEYPAATIHSYGKGKVAYLPFDLFRFFARNPYPPVRRFIGDLAREVIPEQMIQVSAPSYVDVILRRKNGKLIIHLGNRCSGVPMDSPVALTADEIPVSAPVSITIRLPRPPSEVNLLFEDSALSWDYEDGTLSITVSGIRIHAAVVVATTITQDFGSIEHPIRVKD